MSSINFKAVDPSTVSAPAVGKVKLFFSTLTNKFTYKKSDDSIIALEGAAGGNDYYDTSYSPGISDAIYSLLDTSTKGVPTDKSGFLVKISTANTKTILQLFDSNQILDLKKANGDTTFLVGELKVDDILHVVRDGSNVIIISYLRQSEIETITKAALLTKIAGNTLVVGKKYLMNHTTQYIYDGAIINASASEDLVFEAIASNKLSPIVYSIQYPDDIIEFDIYDGTFTNGRISYRTDTKKKLAAPCDWRGVKFRRGLDPETGSFIIADPDNSAFTTSPAPIYMFDDSVSGGQCENITIEKTVTNFDNSDISGSGLDAYNLIDSNNIFKTCKNIHISGYSQMNSFYNNVSIPADVSVGQMNSKIISSRFIIIVDASSITMASCEYCTIIGAQTGQLESDVNRINLTYCSNVTIRDKSEKVDLFDVDSSIFGRIQSSKISSCYNVNAYFVSTSVIEGSQYLVIDQSSNCDIRNSSYCNIHNSDEVHLSNSLNLLLYAVISSKIHNLKGSFKPPVSVGTVFNVVVTPTTKTIQVFDAAAGFSTGDFTNVISGSNITFDREMLIAYDTDGDTVIDIPAQAITMASQSRLYYQNNLTNFMLIFTNPGYELLILSGTDVLPLTGSNLYFDGVTSNLEEETDFDDSTKSITLENSNYNISHAGLVVMNQTNTGDLEKIITVTNNYPNLKRKLQKKTTIDSITAKQDPVKPVNGLLVGSAALLDDEFDFIEFERFGTLWRETSRGLFS